MLILRLPWPQPGIVARFTSVSEALLTLSRIALEGAISSDVANWVARKLPEAMTENPIDQIRVAYQGLPTHYLADGVDDFWQYVGYTLSEKTGDCEDSSTALAAILSYLGIDARIALMPDHAAVVIPVDVDDWGQRSVSGWLLPAEWTPFAYAGREWLGVETTISLRRVPSEGAWRLWQAAAMGSLSIGPSMAALLAALTLRPLPELALTGANRRRRTRR